jgi:hypothetical protein
MVYAAPLLLCMLIRSAKSWCRDGKSKVDIKENCIIIAFSSGDCVPLFNLPAGHTPARYCFSFE